MGDESISAEPLTDLEIRRKLGTNCWVYHYGQIHEIVSRCNSEMTESVLYSAQSARPGIVGRASGPEI